MDRSERARLLRIEAAFRAGDLEALRAELGDGDDFPRGAAPTTIGSWLEFAIYHSPLPFIRKLLELGAEPNPDAGEHAGFPPLIAALSCGRRRPGSAGRDDVLEVVELLLAHGADPDQRGINDYGPLHMAVSEHNPEALEVLIAAGADPGLRTRIDDCETPAELAASLGLEALAARLREAEAEAGDGPARRS